MAGKNVLGTELVVCGTDPMTGFYRDGCCNTGAQDAGLARGVRRGVSAVSRVQQEPWE